MRDRYGSRAGAAGHNDSRVVAARTAASTAARLLAAVLTYCVPSQARAQAMAPSSLPPADPSPVERLLGDWGGLQPALMVRGIGVHVSSVVEVAGNVSGGVKQGATSANQIALNLDVDFERLSGMKGFSTHFVLVNRSGASDSALFGDHLLPVQQIYGAGGNVGVHLVFAYAEQTLFDERLDLAFGRMGVTNDFAQSPLYCNFMTNALCGNAKALGAGDAGQSTYPDAVWAVRARIRPTPDIYVQTGVYEVNRGIYTNKYYRTGFEFDTSQDSGVYIPAEIAWEPAVGPARMPGHYKFGLGYDTSCGYADFGKALAAAHAPGYAKLTRTGHLQIWALADQKLAGTGAEEDAGVTAFAGLVLNDPNKTAYAQQYYVGLVAGGLMRNRPRDSVDLLFTYLAISPRLSSVEGVEQLLGLPFSNKATGVQSRELVSELNYNIHVSRGVTIRPDCQYIIRPDGQANIRDAAVFGLHADIQF